VDNRSPELKRRETAFHEAAHAVAVISFRWTFTEATMGGPAQRPGVYGIAFVGEGPNGCPTTEQQRRMAIQHMAGPEAELIETGADRGRTGHELHVRAGGDQERIARDVMSLLLKRRSPGLGGDETWPGDDVQRATEDARAFVTEHWSEIRAVAEALLEHERLEYDQVVWVAGVARGSG
jgi:hypothetical protein